MVEANLLKYITTRFILGGGPGGYDKKDEFPSKAIYVPSEEMLVLRDSGSNVIIGPGYLIYNVLKGKETAQMFDLLVEKIYGKNPTLSPIEKIDVPDAFVKWAKSLYEARNPSAELSDLLKV